MCGSGCSGRGRTKCCRPKRSGVNVITHKGQDAFYVCVRGCEMAGAKESGMMRVGVCQGAGVYNCPYVCVVCGCLCVLETIKYF